MSTEHAGHTVTSPDEPGPCRHWQRPGGRWSLARARRCSRERHEAVTRGVRVHGPGCTDTAETHGETQCIYCEQ
eukprot:740445-Rhodomonas_salina.1